MATIKIAKFLSEAGIASRRKAQTLVTQGLIFVNGKIMVDPARRIDPDIDRIIYNNKLVKPARNVYYLLNKPVGYTSTTADPYAKNLVTRLVPAVPKVWPVGRLDKLTSGLIIITNDGDLTQKITHPGFLVKKEYEITTDFPLAPVEIAAIRRGLRLEDGFIRPDLFETVNGKTYRIVIHSGKKHIVRRLVKHAGKNVIQLKRTKIGSLSLENLHPGKWRQLTVREIKEFSEAKKQPR